MKTRIPELQKNRLKFLGVTAIAVGPRGIVYVASDADYYKDRITAITASGKSLWSYDVDSVLGLTVDSTGIYATTYQKKLIALGLDGKERWSRNVGIAAAAPAISNGILYVGSKNSNLYAFDINGQLLWRFKTSSPITTGVSIGNNGTIYVRSTNGLLQAFSANHLPKWKIMTGPNKPYDFQIHTWESRLMEQFMFRLQAGACTRFLPMEELNGGI